MTHCVCYLRQNSIPQTWGGNFLLFPEAFLQVSFTVTKDYGTLVRGSWEQYV